MENYETGVYLGVDEAPPEFDVRSKVLGETVCIILLFMMQFMQLYIESCVELIVLSL